MTYQAVPMVDYDAATAKLAQLRALLLSITSDGFEAFERMDSPFRHDLLWLASDLAGQAQEHLASADAEK